jgi:hypothetical protein
MSMDKLQEYIDYHIKSYEIGDIDPSYEMLKYVCERFELNIEQRYWLAFLYSTCYNGATVYYMYNEFPDFETLDINRLQNWWNKNRDKCVFQTDRKWVKNNNQFVNIYKSYKLILSGKTQQQFFSIFTAYDPTSAYKALYTILNNVEYVSRFTLFIWLECIHILTGLNIKPDRLDLKPSSSDNCRNAIVHAMGRDDLLSGDIYGVKLPNKITEAIENKLLQIIGLIKSKYPDYRVDVWNIETSLCAYYKWVKGLRYIGYYLDRQADEIKAMEKNVTEGVNWKVLWDYRSEKLDRIYLTEFGSNNKGK